MIAPKSELHGNEALVYARERLKEVRTDVQNWTTEYLDESTGERWLMDYPRSELQGGGPPRLRRLP
jgi:hypothetical protein